MRNDSRPDRCSVLIPAHNAELFIQNAIASALTQTYPDVEVIVVNDGSTDGTEAIIQGFGDQVIYLKQQNLGPAAARNLALMRATGEFIAFLDADDEWTRDHVAKLISFLSERPKFGIVTSDSYLVYGEEKSLETFYRHGGGRRGFRYDDQAYWILQYNFLYGMAVVRHDLFRRHGPFDESVPWGVEDWELFIRLITRGEQAGFVTEPLGYYRITESSLSHGLRSSYERHLQLFEAISTRPECSSIRGFPGRLSFARACVAIASGNRKDARALSKASALDAELPHVTRVKSALAWISPSLAWKLNSRRFLSTRKLASAP